MISFRSGAIKKKQKPKKTHVILFRFRIPRSISGKCFKMNKIWPQFWCAVNWRMVIFWWYVYLHIYDFRLQNKRFEHILKTIFEKHAENSSNLQPNRKSKIKIRNKNPKLKKSKIDSFSTTIQNLLAYTVAAQSLCNDAFYLWIAFGSSSTVSPL